MLILSNYFSIEIVMFFDMEYNRYLQKKIGFLMLLDLLLTEELGNLELRKLFVKVFNQ